MTPLAKGSDQSTGTSANLRPGLGGPTAEPCEGTSPGHKGLGAPATLRPHEGGAGAQGTQSDVCVTPSWGLHPTKELCLRVQPTVTMKPASTKRAFSQSFPHSALSGAQDGPRTRPPFSLKEAQRRARLPFKGPVHLAVSLMKLGVFLLITRIQLLPEVRETRHTTHFSNVWFIRFS